MTHATPKTEKRHDTVTRVTGKSGRGTARQTIRIDETLWEQFDAATKALGTDRSTWLRDAIQWCVRDAEAKAPKRPAE